MKGLLKRAVLWLLVLIPSYWALITAISLIRSGDNMTPDYPAAQSFCSGKGIRGTLGRGQAIGNLRIIKIYADAALPRNLREWWNAERLRSVGLLCKYETGGSEKGAVRYADLHFEYREGQWVFVPEDRRFVLGKIALLAIRPDLFLSHYYKLLFVPDYPILELRRCRQNPDHAFWTYLYPYCPFDGERLSEPLQRKLVKLRTIKGEWVYAGRRREGSLLEDIRVLQ